ncbi:MAG: uracil-DNA glycosylase [Acidobacteria bacterium]|nr:uracil-DNA glycosylase [Acidobacteriota bacterium]
MKLDRNKELEALQCRIMESRLCPRLVEHREKVAREKKRVYRDWEYWGKPVPSFGGIEARLLIIGLAPAAHGGNRTGRIFTGDRSGDFLFAALYRSGFCNQPTSISRDDGLELYDAYITAAIHCVPPDNRPLRAELENCRGYLREELRLLTRVRVVVPLGSMAWGAYLKACRELGKQLPHPLPKFGHGREYLLESGVALLGSYHPSQQNTQTGRLTASMLDAVFKRARHLINTR